MWLQRWIWERYKELRLKIGMDIEFTFNKAKEILSYDSDQTLYKVLNELEQLKIIKVERSRGDGRVKIYRIVLGLEDVPYSGLTIPSDYKTEPEFLASTGSMAISGSAVPLSLPPSKTFEKVYNKESIHFVTIMPEKPAETIEEYLIRLIQEYKSPEAVLSIIQKREIDFDKVIKKLNLFFS